MKVLRTYGRPVLVVALVAACVLALVASWPDVTAALPQVGWARFGVSTLLAVLAGISLAVGWRLLLDDMVVFDDELTPPPGGDAGEAPVEPARRARRVGRRVLGEPARQVHPGQRVAGGRPDVAVAPPRHHAALDRGGLRQPAAAAGGDRRRHRRHHAAVGRRRPAPVAVVAHRARPADLPRAGAGGAELAARRGRTRAPSRPGVPRAEPAGDAAHRRDVGADLRVLRPAPRRDGVAADGPSDGRRHRPVHRRVRAGVGGRLRGDLRAGGPRRARARADGDAVVAAGEGGRHGARRAVTHLDRARRPRARALRSGGHRGEPQTLGGAAGSGRRTWSGAGRPGCRP